MFFTWFIRQAGTAKQAAKKWSRALAVQHTDFLDTQVQVQVMDLVYDILFSEYFRYGYNLGKTYSTI